MTTPAAPNEYIHFAAQMATLAQNSRPNPTTYQPSDAIPGYGQQIPNRIPTQVGLPSAPPQYQGSSSLSFNGISFPQTVHYPAQPSLPPPGAGLSQYPALHSTKPHGSSGMPSALTTTQPGTTAGSYPFQHLSNSSLVHTTTGGQSATTMPSSARPPISRDSTSAMISNSIINASKQTHSSLVNAFTSQAKLNRDGWASAAEGTRHNALSQLNTAIQPMNVTGHINHGGMNLINPTANGGIVSSLNNHSQWQHQQNVNSIPSSHGAHLGNNGNQHQRLLTQHLQQQQQQGYQAQAAAQKQFQHLQTGHHQQVPFAPDLSAVLNPSIASAIAFGNRKDQQVITYPYQSVEYPGMAQGHYFNHQQPQAQGPHGHHHVAEHPMPAMNGNPTVGGHQHHHQHQHPPLAYQSQPHAGNDGGVHASHSHSPASVDAMHTQHNHHHHLPLSHPSPGSSSGHDDRFGSSNKTLLRSGKPTPTPGAGRLAQQGVEQVSNEGQESSGRRRSPRGVAASAAAAANAVQEQYLTSTDDIEGDYASIPRGRTRYGRLTTSSATLPIDTTHTHPSPSGKGRKHGSTRATAHRTSRSRPVTYLDPSETLDSDDLQQPRKSYTKRQRQLLEQQHLQQYYDEFGNPIASSFLHQDVVQQYHDSDSSRSESSSSQSSPGFDPMHPDATSRSGRSGSSRYGGSYHDSLPSSGRRRRGGGFASSRSSAAGDAATGLNAASHPSACLTKESAKAALDTTKNLLKSTTSSIQGYPAIPYFFLGLDIPLDKKRGRKAKDHNPFGLLLQQEQSQHQQYQNIQQIIDHVQRINRQMAEGEVFQESVQPSSRQKTGDHSNDDEIVQLGTDTTESDATTSPSTTEQAPAAEEPYQQDLQLVLDEGVTASLPAALVSRLTADEIQQLHQIRHLPKQLLPFITASIQQALSSDGQAETPGSSLLPRVPVISGITPPNSRPTSAEDSSSATTAVALTSSTKSTSGSTKASNLPVCTFCNKTFRDRYYLERHTVIHTGYKAFECCLCGLRFTQEGHLTRHIKVLHWQQLSFHCGTCKILFTHDQHDPKHRGVLIARQYEREKQLYLQQQHENMAHGEHSGVDNHCDCHHHHHHHDHEHEHHHTCCTEHEHLQQQPTSQDGATTASIDPSMAGEHTNNMDSSLSAPQSGADSQHPSNEITDVVLTPTDRSLRSTLPDSTLATCADHHSDQDPTKCPTTTPVANPPVTIELDPMLSTGSIPHSLLTTSATKNDKVVSCVMCHRYLQAHGSLLAFNNYILAERARLLRSSQEGGSRPPTASDE